MTISKRTRFEILRRDDFKCHYCGRRADETELHVDHFVPVALGGTDEPANLVAACHDCNQGKASVPLGAPLLEQLNEKVAVYKAAQQRAMTELGMELDDQDDYEKRVVELWDYYIPQYRHASVGESFAQNVYDWHARGVPLSVVEKGIRIAAGASHVPWRGRWDYAAGVVRNTVGEAERRHDVNPETGHTREYDRGREDGYQAGFDDGYGYAEGTTRDYDLLARHIDGRTEGFGWQTMKRVRRVA